jgi:hypothetical protein
MDKQIPKNQNSNEILFRPLSDGLGFHPFSDGLPYAPVGKNPKANTQSPPAAGNLSSGAGATAAGPPRIAQAAKGAAGRLGAPERSSEVPRISVPVAKPERELSRPGIPPSLTQTPAERKGLVSPSQKVQLPQPVFGMAYVTKRVLAYWVDFMMSLGLCSGILSSLVLIQDLDTSVLAQTSVLFVLCIFFLGFHWFLMMIQEVVFKSTLGKKIFGLAFRASSTILFLRAVFFIPSIACLGLGIFWCLIDRQRCCWHDRLVRAQPLEVARL